MMSNFKAGDLVVCVRKDNDQPITVGKLYKVNKVNDLYVYVNMDNGEGEGGFVKGKFSIYTGTSILRELF